MPADFVHCTVQMVLSILSITPLTWTFAKDAVSAQTNARNRLSEWRENNSLRMKFDVYKHG